MKKIKLFALLSIFVMGTASLFIFAKRPADDKPETITVRAHYYYKATAWIDYGNGRIEETQLPGNNNLKDAESSSSKILELIQKLNSEGYKVLSQSNYAHAADNETWVLVKK